MILTKSVIFKAVTTIRIELKMYYEKDIILEKV